MSENTTNLMMDLKDVSFETFKEIALMLQFSKEEQMESWNVTKRLQRFIGNMNSAQALVMEGIVRAIFEDKDNDAKLLYEEFLHQYPNLLFDPNGNQEITKFQAFQISLESVEMAFDDAEKYLKAHDMVDDIDGNPHWQVYNAKKLDPLMKIKAENVSFPLLLNLYLKNTPQSALSHDEAVNMKTKIEALIGQSLVPQKILKYLQKKSYKSTHYFVQHFLLRLDIATQDKELEHPVNKEFVETLKKLV